MYKYYKHDMVHLGTMICSLCLECNLNEEVANEEADELEMGVGIQAKSRGTMKTQTALAAQLINVATKVEHIFRKWTQYTFWCVSFDSTDSDNWSSYIMTCVGSPVYSENVRASILAWVAG